MTVDEYNTEKSLNLILQQIEILKQKFIEERKKLKTTKGPNTQRMLYDLLKENFKYNNPSLPEKEIDEELLEEIRMIQGIDNSELLNIHD